MRPDLVQHAGAIVLVGHVSPAVEHVSAQRPQSLHRLRHHRLFVHVHHRDIQTLVGQGVRDAVADAAACSCNQRNPLHTAPFATK